MKIMQDLKEDKESFEKMGITYEEKAFYDILIKVRDDHNSRMLKKNAWYWRRKSRNWLMIRLSMRTGLQETILRISSTWI